MAAQADLDEDKAIFEHTPPIMLAPNAPEAILLVLVISIGLTVMLHTVSLTHIVGILILVIIAKLNSLTFNSYVVGLFSRIMCANSAPKPCQEIIQAYLAGLGGRTLAWVSGVRPDETVFDMTGALSEQFLYRAGVIGAVATFVVVYNIVGALYLNVYSLSKASTTIAELEVSASEQSIERTDSGRHTNPLVSPEDTSKEVESGDHANPLKIPDNHCSTCEALEATQEEWVDSVRQYGEASATIVEENNGLREQVKMLEREVAGLREEVRISQDRIAYLDVLLEEAGKQLGCDADV
jgi:hypothetical protein